MDTVTSIGDRGNPGQKKGGGNPMRGDAHRHALAEVSGASRHTIDDVATVLGMPDGDVPAPVQARIVALMEEVERLRAELVQVRHHEMLLRNQADHHPTLPVAHRRAFVRDLGRLLAQARRNNLPGTVIQLHLDGIEALRELHGPEAAEGALAKAIETLRGETDQADAIGYLEGGNFAVALALVGEPEARARAQQLAARLAAMPFLINGVRAPFVVGWGHVAFDAADSAETLVRMAEAARRATRSERPV